MRFGLHFSKTSQTDIFIIFLGGHLPCCGCLGFRHLGMSIFIIIKRKIYCQVHPCKSTFKEQDRFTTCFKTSGLIPRLCMSPVSLVFHTIVTVKLISKYFGQQSGFNTPVCWWKSTTNVDRQNTSSYHKTKSPTTRVSIFEILMHLIILKL